MTSSSSSGIKMAVLVLTWCCGGSVRLHQFQLSHLFSVLLAHVVLLGHERVVEGGLADGAETVRVVVVVVVAAAAARRRHTARIICRFLLQLSCWWCLGGYCKRGDTIKTIREMLPFIGITPLQKNMYENM